MEVAAPRDGGGTAALFTLLGVGITAAVSLVAILLKHVLDSRTEARRHARQLELDDREHARNLDRMRLELAERRADAAEGQQVQAMARFLAESLAIYTQITMIRQAWERDRDDAKCRDALLSISPADAQMAFEEVRPSPRSRSPRGRIACGSTCADRTSRAGGGSTARTGPPGRTATGRCARH